MHFVPRKPYANQIDELDEEWRTNPRWQGVKRGYSASALTRWLFVVFGIVLESVHSAQAAQPSIETETIETHLYALKVATTPVPFGPSDGGAITPLHNDLLLATPYGSLYLVGRRGEVVAIDGQVPMGLADLLHQAQTRPDPPASGSIRTDRFRVTDILLKRLARARYRLFATHLYFTGSCIRFRLSSTTVGLLAGFLDASPRTIIDLSVSPSWKTIFDADPCLPIDWHALHESGGKMLMDGDEHLLVTVGNFGKSSDEPIHGKDFGKLLRININTGTAEVFARGLRNAQGLARDRDGNLWETEHGPQGGDELNLMEACANYGWPKVSYGVHYGRRVVGDWPVERLARHDGFARPVFAWVPSIGISSIAVNDGRFFPLWSDDLLIGSLVGKSLFRVRRHGRQVSYVERINVGEQPIRDIAQLADGRIALLSSYRKVLFLSRAYAPYCGPDARPRHVYAVDCPD